MGGSQVAWMGSSLGRENLGRGQLYAAASTQDALICQHGVGGRGQWVLRGWPGGDNQALGGSAPEMKVPALN